MQDTPNDMTATIVCPACGSENVESLPAAGAVAANGYRCLDCGAEFDASGGESPLNDSDDPDAP